MSPSYLFLHYIYAALLFHLYAGKDIEENCRVCRKIVKNFHKGMDKTAKDHFGGGDTAWEESRLGKYSRSETRLLEILENVCENLKDSSCHAIVEEYEEEIEKFWFNEHKVISDLDDYLCISRVKACCPFGKFGSKCKDCPTKESKVCFGRGKCEGNGTRGGDGSCECDLGYSGDICDECDEGYYDSGNTTCQKCHDSCSSSCSDGSSRGCDYCKEGYEEDDENGCVDKDECEDHEICEEGKFCINSIGSYRCNECDPACSGGCNGTGRLSCNGCATGWKLRDSGRGCDDVDECENKDICDLGTYCINNLGSYKCKPCNVACSGGCTGSDASACKECAAGYKLTDEGCVDINECLEKNLTCPMGQVCVNKPGPDSCELCHSSCISCVSPDQSGCLQCHPGYILKENGCEDINECTSNPCTAEGERCLNQPGSYLCKCKKGWVRTKKGNCKKKSAPAKKSKKGSEETKNEDKEEL